MLIRKRFLSNSFNFIHQPTWKSHPHLLSKPEIVPGIKAETYQKRITELGKRLENNSTVIVPSFKTSYSTRNIVYPFQQNNNLLYLTGFNEPDCCLVISKMSGELSVDFHVTPGDENMILWSGPRAGIEGAKELFGFTNVYAFDEQRLAAQIFSRRNHIIYSDFHDNSAVSQKFRESLNEMKTVKLSPLINSMRLVKSQEEIDLMKKSGEIASIAFKESMAYSKGAKSEAELASFMEYRVRALGGDRLAYVPVVASETRGLVLHYTHNNQLLRDWMLMDAGAMYFGYCSDITRSWPLNGRFSNPQAKLYEAVLRVQEGCQRAVEGIEKCSFGLLNELAVYLTCEELRRLGFRNVERNVSRWFPHSIGHHLGLDLHDSTDDNQKHPLVPGNVITIEPGLYIPVNDFDAPEQFRGLAIRIEDDFVIGKGGSLTNMTEKVPKTISEIEELLQ